MAQSEQQDFSGVRGYDILRMMDFSDVDAAARQVESLVRGGRVDGARIADMLTSLYRRHCGDGGAQLPLPLQVAVSPKVLAQDPVAAVSKIEAMYGRARDEVLSALGLVEGDGRLLDAHEFSRMATLLLEKGRSFSYLTVSSIEEPTVQQRLLAAQQDVETRLFSELCIRFRGYDVGVQRAFRDAMRPRMETRERLEGYVDDMRRFDALPLGERLLAREPKVPFGIIDEKALVSHEERYFDRVVVPELPLGYRMCVVGDDAGMPFLALRHEGSEVARVALPADGGILAAVEGIPSSVSSPFFNAVSSLGAAVEAVRCGEDVLSVQPLRASDLYGDVYAAMERRLDNGGGERRSLVYPEVRDRLLGSLSAGADSGAMTVKGDGGEVYGTLVPVRSGDEVLGMVYVPNRGVMDDSGTPPLVKVVSDDVGDGFRLSVDGIVPRDEVRALERFLARLSLDNGRSVGRGVRI